MVSKALVGSELVHEKIRKAQKIHCKLEGKNWQKYLQKAAHQHNERQNDKLILCLMQFWFFINILCRIINLIPANLTPKWFFNMSISYSCNQVNLIILWSNHATSAIKNCPVNGNENEKLIEWRKRKIRAAKRNKGQSEVYKAYKTSVMFPLLYNSRCSKTLVLKGVHQVFIGSSCNWSRTWKWNFWSCKFSNKV